MKNIKNFLSAIHLSTTMFVTMIGVPLMPISSVMADSTDIPPVPIIEIEFDETNCEKNPDICFITPNVSWNS